MNRVDVFLDRYPWAPLGFVMTALVLLALPVLFMIVLFFLGEAAIGS